MRRYLILLGALVLAACSSGANDLAGLLNGTSIPSKVTMTGLSDSLKLRVGSNVSWQIASLADWLTISPRSGIGPKDIQLQTQFAGVVQDVASYDAKLQLSGDVNAEITVTLPLVEVKGQVAQSAVARVAPTQVSSTSSIGSVRFRPLATGNTGEVLVKYRAGSVGSNAQLRSMAQSVGANTRSVDINNRLSKLTSSNPEALLARLRADPNVEWAELNGYVTALGEPTDQFYPKQWHLVQTGARFSYLQAFSNQVTVAVVDTGVRYDHPDLQGRLWLPGEGAYDFVGPSIDSSDVCGRPADITAGDNDPTDPCDSFAMSGGSHGTHVTGLIVANVGTFTKPCSTCSDSGVVGVDYAANVKVLPLRVLNSQGNGSFEDVALAVRYAAGLSVVKNGVTLQNPHPAKVVNLSLGSLIYSNEMCDAIKDSTNAGTLVVAAAGNYQDSNPGGILYPAACDGAVSVAATDRNNQNTYYSQQNAYVDLAVPGGNTTTGTGGEDGILSTTWNYQANSPNYTFYMGTSQASPQAAAAIAMVLSSGKASTAAEAYVLIKAKLTDLGAPGRDNVYGDGFLNLPGVFGWALPKGPVTIRFSGPSSRQITPSSGQFVTHLIPGSYQMTVCTDDSGNSLCDSGEQSTQKPLNAVIGPAVDVGLVSP